MVVTRRSCVPAWQRYRRNQLWLDRLDPSARARQGLCAEHDARAGRPADPARQHPRSWLLPLNSCRTRAAGPRAADADARGQRERHKMLTHPTHDRLIALGLTGMAKALEEQRRQPDIAALGVRGAARTPRRPRGHRARKQEARQPIEVRKPAPDRPSSRMST